MLLFDISAGIPAWTTLGFPTIPVSEENGVTTRETPNKVSLICANMRRGRRWIWRLIIWPARLPASL